MLKEIKAYWYELKTEYENRYGEEILRDYDRSKEFLEKMQGYLGKSFKCRYSLHASISEA